MKAVRIHAYGGSDEMVYEDAPAPEIGAGQVLVRVKAISVNPLDWKIREGMTKAFFTFDMPLILGCDVAGVVEQAAPDVTAFKVGDEVFGMVGRVGAYAELVAVPAAQLALKPATATFVQAASISLATLTASQLLFDHGGLQAGQRVLINAAAGGVGGFAVQLAHEAGAYVIATTSAGKMDYVRGLGADEVIDYQAGPFEADLEPVDVAVDVVGGDTRDRALLALKPGGRLVSAAGVPAADKVAAAGVTAVAVAVQPKGDQLARFAALYDAGKLTTEIAQVLTLSQAAQALDGLKAGRTVGKIVLTV